MTENKELDSRVEVLENIASNHEEEITALETNTSVLAAEVSELQGIVADNVLEIEEINGAIAQLENIVGQDAVAFHAILNDFTPYPDQVIVYGN